MPSVHHSLLAVAGGFLLLTGCAASPAFHAAAWQCHLSADRSSTFCLADQTATGAPSTPADWEALLQRAIQDAVQEVEAGHGQR